MVRVVVGIISDEHGRYLFQQRGTHDAFPGKWEFPGGKLEPGETNRQALVRELHEELGLRTITIGATVLIADFDPPEVPVETTLFFYEVETSDEPTIREDQRALAWLRPQDTRHLSLTPGSERMLQRLLEDEGRDAAD